MTVSVVDADLANISSEEALLDGQYEMAERWLAQGADIAAVKSVLGFMEQHPGWDFGTPGALVHFVEKFHRKGYQELLVQSVGRAPTVHTLWMLNRIINGEQDAERKAAYVELLSRVASDSGNDEEVIAQAREYLEFQSEE
ncbi:MAG TPA: hypothetical protein VH105_05415 [Burkholderiales bacterium]|jgi:hypothetical protein|nr:hypothetical protein [Burkholderiales bacterium]